MTTIYVYLPDEAVDVWRPVEATRINDTEFIIDPQSVVPDDERWAFQPGDRVYCEMRKFYEGEGLVAIRLAD